MLKYVKMDKASDKPRQNGGDSGLGLESVEEALTQLSGWHGNSCVSTITSGVLELIHKEFAVVYF